MLHYLRDILDADTLSPHGICLLWRPELIWIHAVSDLVIGLAYLSIPLALAYFVARREDIAFGWVLWCFVAFILACGATHFLSIVTLWTPIYGVEGLVKAATALVSAATAVALWFLIPKALALPSPAQLRRVNQDLMTRIAERDEALAALETATRERLRAEEALRQSQKMEAVGQLTGGLAHDFNNLLAGISGSLELVQSRIAKGRPQEIDRFITAAQGASKRAAALTHRLLAFSRRQTLDPKPTDVNRLVRGIEDMIRRTVGPEIHFEVAEGIGLWSALVDPPQLENALLNLCINARDAMPDGGRLTIEAANRHFDEAAAAEHDLDPGPYLSISVSDTGIGMSPDVAARAFDPFFTTKPIGMGTGLGLSMIYGFAKQSGGQVRIRSKVGEGTTVCIHLPRHGGEADREEVAARAVEAPRAAWGETVLVVDDEPTVRMLIAEVLKDLGYRVIEAVDGATGLKVLQSDIRIDMLITDVGLPGGINGRQVADAGRALRPSLKVLFVTGYAESAVLGGGLIGAGMQILTKPFAVEDLTSRVRSLDCAALRPVA